MVKRIVIVAVTVFICGFSASVFGQKAVTIKLDNPSFEDYPEAGHTPEGWFDCGFDGQSAPDVQPCGSFGVMKTAYKGDTYVGMVVRDNITWEAVGQKLKSELLKNVTYSFSVYACRSKRYESQSQKNGKEASYTTPIIIRIWGGSDFCAKLDLLAESKLIKSYDWEKLDFVLKPTINSTHFMIEAYYSTNGLPPYSNGNVLVDNLSDIVPILDKKD